MGIVLLVAGLLQYINGFFNPGPWFDLSSSSNSTTEADISNEQIALILGIILVFVVIMTPIIVFINNMIAGMAAYTAINTANGKTITFGQAFKAALSKFWRVLWISIIVGFKIIVGLFFFVIPGIRAMLRYQMVLIPVFEKDASAKEAIEISKSITKNHLMEVFGMVFAAGLIPFVGYVMNIGGQSIMYPQLKKLKESGADKPKVHWANYLAFIIAGAMILLSTLIVATIVLALKLASNS